MKKKRISDKQKIVRFVGRAAKGRYAIFYVINVNPQEVGVLEIYNALHKFDQNFMYNLFVDERSTQIHIYGCEQTRERFLRQIEDFKKEHEDDDSTWVKEKIEYMEGAINYLDSLEPLFIPGLVEMLRVIKYDKEIDKIEGGLTKYPMFLDVVTAYDCSLGLRAEDVLDRSFLELV